jgi:hypothetical protein
MNDCINLNSILIILGGYDMEISFRFKRGLKKYLPRCAALGEPLFCLDDHKLYIGDGPTLSVREVIINPKFNYVLLTTSLEKLFLIKRGPSHLFPYNAEIGEPIFCTSTGSLYVGLGSELPICEIGIVDYIEYELMLDYYKKLFYL